MQFLEVLKGQNRVIGGKCSTSVHATTKTNTKVLYPVLLTCFKNTVTNIRKFSEKSHNTIVRKQKIFVEGFSKLVWFIL